MSYQVLARKYRPTNFEEVVGKDHVVKALSNSISQDRIHQAYLGVILYSLICAVRSTSDFLARKRIAGALQSSRPSHAPGRRALFMLPATPEAGELQQLPLELPRYLLVAPRESGGQRAYALLPPYDMRSSRRPIVD